MKILSSIFLIILSAGMLCAQEMTPDIILRLTRSLERGQLHWHQQSAVPLTKTIRQPFARNSWRLVYSRAGEDVANSGLNHFNTIELILVKKREREDLAELRKKLTWAAAPEELHTVICYIGVVDHYHFFVKADIITIHWLIENFRPKNGEPVEKFYANALNVEDYKNTSKRAAVVFLPQSGDRAIPYIVKAMAHALIENDTVLPHLIALKNIGTEKAADELMKALKSENSGILEAMPEAMKTLPYWKEGKKIYLALMEKHSAVIPAINAALTFHWGKDILPVIDSIRKEPVSLNEFIILTYADRQFRTGQNDNPENESMEQIQVLLLRLGDTKGSPKMINITDKASKADMQFQTESGKRIAPAEQVLIKSKHTDCAIAAALYLAAFQPKANTYSKEYIQRVRLAGEHILQKLPRSQVRLILYQLINNVENHKESEFFKRLLLKYPAVK